MVIFGYDTILCPWNTFSSEIRRENVDEECQPCPDGNSSKRLVSDRCNTNAATKNSEAASSPTVISDTPRQSNPTKYIRSKLIQAQSRGGLEGATKAFIVPVASRSLLSYYIPYGVRISTERSPRSLLKYSICMDPVWRLPLAM